ncbi:MAG TPA: hypothetical protein VHN14_23025 [Kofleriaceae bacterium]|jgi:hypothetical protein|nr:hypothetical protein [Kofleriaceae bacterium]
MTAAPTPMSRAHRAYVIAMCAVIGGAFAYAACDWGHWPHLTYVPLSGTLVMEPTKAIAIHYIGFVAWGTGGACTGALAGAVACRAVPRPWPARVYRLLGAWAITAILLAGSYFTWNLWPW